MAGETKATTDHETIRRWAEERDGAPATVRGTDSDGEPGVLTIDLPGGAGEDRLQHITWDEWFQKFEENHLAFVYQDEKADREGSTFFKLVSRDRVGV